MKKALVSTVIVVFVCLFISCSREYMREDELNAYVVDIDNGVKKCLQVTPYSVCIQYRPTDLLVAQELGDASDSMSIHLLRKKYNANYYFILSLSREGHEALSTKSLSGQQYGELVQIISFRMSDYLNATTNERDTIPLTDFLYNRMFDTSNSTDIMLVFNKDKIKNKQWVQINLTEFGLGLGEQSIRFEITSLENVPKIFPFK